MENLRQRVDPKTGLVRPRWKQVALELHVSRSTIARQMAELYACGAYERIYVKVQPKGYNLLLSPEGLKRIGLVPLVWRFWYNSPHDNSIYG